MKLKVSMNDVAQEAGVSKMTVSLALRKDPQIPAETQERVDKIAARLNYTGNPEVAELMARLRASRQASFQATLGLVNANEDGKAFQRHPTIPTYVKGITQSAQCLGYALDYFWLYDPQYNPRQLYRILRTRNIRGLLLVGLMENNRLPSGHELLWDNFSWVATGVKTSNPTFSFSCVDHHAAVQLAFQKACEHGYRRPALVLDEVIDRLIERRFLAGSLVAQMELPLVRRVPAFMKVREADDDPALFNTWFQRYQPDCLITLYHRIEGWVRQLSKRIPQEVGLIQLEWREDHPQWSGIMQHNDLAGAAALNMVIQHLHQSQSGVPSNPQATLISGTWKKGATLR
jgi:DNA-binding LacI/PurR family transcriptional regulator